MTSDGHVTKQGGVWKGTLPSATVVRRQRQRTETERETETETLEALLFESRPGHALMDGREREIRRCRGGRAARM